MEPIGSAVPRLRLPAGIEVAPVPRESFGIQTTTIAAVRERMQPDMAEVLKRAGIPQRYVGKTFADFEIRTARQRDILAFVQTYEAEFAPGKPASRSVMFGGPPGTGKTLLACCILNALALRRVSVRYSNASEIIRALRDTYSGRGMSYGDTLASYADPELLWIDEVGVTSAIRDEAMESERALLLDVVNRRYDANLPTGIASNLTADDLELSLGSRVYDRLCEGGGEFLVCGGASMRRAK